jgi:hypothetical protein
MAPSVCASTTIAGIDQVLVFDCQVIVSTECGAQRAGWTEGRLDDEPLNSVDELGAVIDCRRPHRLPVPFLAKERTPRMRRTPTSPCWRWLASQSVPKCDPARPAHHSSWEVRSGVRLGRSSVLMRYHPRFWHTCSRSSGPVLGSDESCAQPRQCGRLLRSAAPPGLHRGTATATGLMGEPENHRSLPAYPTAVVLPQHPANSAGTAPSLLPSPKVRKNRFWVIAKAELKEKMDAFFRSPHPEPSLKPWAGYGRPPKART